MIVVMILQNGLDSQHGWGLRKFGGLYIGGKLPAAPLFLDDIPIYIN
jgi:hypothetical protein